VPAAEATAFPGDSEMAARCRALDWAATPLGPVAGWSAALRGAVRLCLDTGFPGCVYAGEALVMVYNDGFAAILGEKHPAAFGRPARDALPEVWAEIAGDFARVRATGAPVVRSDARLVLARGPAGAGVEGFYTYTFSPLRDDAGAVVAVYNVVTETTARVRAERALTAERERLRSLILHMPAPLALAEGPEHRFTVVNDAYRRVSGGRDITGLTTREAFPELAGQGIWERFDAVYASGVSWVGPETPSRYDRDGTGPIDTWFDLRLDPVRDAEGRVTAVLNFAVDVTEQVRARRDVERLLAESERARAAAERAAAALAESEARFRAVEDASPDAVLLLRPLREGSGGGVGGRRRGHRLRVRLRQPRRRPHARRRRGRRVRGASHAHPVPGLRPGGHLRRVRAGARDRRAVHP
jgi:PAS domain-containing protein